MISWTSSKLKTSFQKVQLKGAKVWKKISLISDEGRVKSAKPLHISMLSLRSWWDSSPALHTCYSKCGPRTRSVNITWELLSSAESPALSNLLNQNLHLNKILRWFCTSTLGSTPVQDCFLLKIQLYQSDKVCESPQNWLFYSWEEEWRAPHIE